MKYKQIVPKYNLGGNITSFTDLYTGRDPIKKKFAKGEGIHIKPSKNHAYGGEIPQYNMGGVLSGAASGASIGSVAGPWGTVIGAVGGALAGLIGGNNRRRQQELDMQQARRINRDRQGEIYKMNDQAVLSQYEQYGNPYTSYYADGGVIDLEEGADYEVEGNEVVQGQAVLEDGNPIATDLQVAEGPSHEQGGVLGVGGERVFSDRKKVDNSITELLSELGIGKVKGKTYADVAENIGKKKGKMEEKLLSTFTPSNRTAEKTLPRMDAALDILFESQEAEKEQEEQGMFAKGGKIKPYRKIDSHQDGGLLGRPMPSNVPNWWELPQGATIPNTYGQFLPEGYFNMYRGKKSNPQEQQIEEPQAQPVQGPRVNLNPFQYRNPFQYNVDFNNPVSTPIVENPIATNSTRTRPTTKNTTPTTTIPRIDMPTLSEPALDYTLPNVDLREPQAQYNQQQLPEGSPVSPQRQAQTPQEQTSQDQDLQGNRNRNFDWGNLIGQVGNLGSYLSNRQDIANLDTSVQRTLMPMPAYSYVDRSQPERREVGRMVRTGQKALGSSSRTVNAANQAAIIAQGLSANNQISQQENRNRDRYDQFYNDRVWRTMATNTSITNQASDQRRELENEKNVRLPQQARTAFMQGVMGNEANRQRKKADEGRLKMSALLNDNNGVLSRAAEKLGYANVDEYINSLLNR